MATSAPSSSPGSEYSIDPGVVVAAAERDYFNTGIAAGGSGSLTRVGSGAASTNSDDFVVAVEREDFGTGAKGATNF